jgi:ribosomal protein S27AE
MGETIGILINQRPHAVELKAPVCPKCGQEMKLHEVRGKTVHGLEGQTRVERSYYVCPNECGETVFPPGSESATAEGSVE